MNRSAILFIAPFFFVCFLGWSNSDLDFHYYVDYSHENGPQYIMTTEQINHTGDNGWKSKNENVW